MGNKQSYSLTSSPSKKQKRTQQVDVAPPEYSNGDTVTSHDDDVSEFERRLSEVLRDDTIECDELSDIFNEVFPTG